MAASPCLRDLRCSRCEPLCEWPYLGRETLRATRTHQVCMTCHWFRHHEGPEGIPLLSCQLRQALNAHGDHLTHRCPKWSQLLHHRLGWCPEAA